MRRTTAAALAVLVGVTWRLWLAKGDFPQIPWLTGLCSIPLWLDAGLLVVLGGAVIAALCGPATVAVTRVACGIAAFALLWLLLLDQHRLQPWAYQLGLLFTLMALAPNARGLACGRMLIVSIYLWSAWSKLDPEFPESHGQLLLEGLARSAGQSTALWSENLKRAAAFAMPAAEAATGLLLAWPQRQRWGLAAATGMHLALIAALGPWGLQHEPAVLIWNGVFIVQNLLLFGRRPVPLRSDADSAEPENPATKLDSFPRRFADGLALGIVGLVMALPLLNIAGWFDHWPSWSVYSSRPATVQVYVSDSHLNDLPASLIPLVDPPLPLTEWRRLRIEQWSFAACGAPPYPQARWRLAVAEALAERAELRKGDLRIRISSRRSWWTTDRTQTILDGRRALNEWLSQYRANTRARHPAAGE